MLFDRALAIPDNPWEWPLDDVEDLSVEDEQAIGVTGGLLLDQGFPVEATR